MSQFANCLTSETIVADSNGLNGAIGYTYDNVGNRLQQTSSVPGISAGLFHYDPNDRLSTDTYDPNGNTLTSAGNPNTNGYDFENHLVQQGAITIVYDGDGNRVSKSVSGVVTKYLVDEQSPTGYAQVVLEDNTAMGEKQYVYGLQLLSERYQLSAGSATFTNSYYGYDGHGSVRLLTSSTGSITDTYDYDAFGNLLHITGTTPNVYRFAGEQWDPDLNLYYNRARYLSTAKGRFLTIDAFLGDPESPLSLHRYLYAEGDPVENLDPSGDQIDDVLAAISVSMSLDVIAQVGVSTLLQGIPKEETTRVTLQKNSIAEIVLTITTTPVAQTYGSVGMKIVAEPTNCANCKWVQTFNVSGKGVHTDWTPDAGSPIDPKPILGNNGGGEQDILWDSPSFPAGTTSGWKHFVSSIGIYETGKFWVLGSITWGFDVLGRVKMLTPRESTAAEQQGSLYTIRKENPLFNVVP